MFSGKFNTHGFDLFMKKDIELPSNLEEIPNNVQIRKVKNDEEIFLVNEGE